MGKLLKSGIDTVNDVMNVLEIADVLTNTGVTGEVKHLNQKLNSTKEDIIVFCSDPKARQVTENIIHINIHVPNLKNEPSGVPNAVDNTQPNIARMEEIGSFIMEVFDDYRGNDFFIQLDSSGEVIPNNGKWYYNIVLRYFYLRTDKN